MRAYTGSCAPLADFAVDAVAAGKELLKTEDGRIRRIGLCHATAMVGHTMFHVLGSRLPVLLRPYTPATGISCQSAMYTLIGICFARDLSDDEVVSEAFSQDAEIRILLELSTANKCLEGGATVPVSIPRIKISGCVSRWQWGTRISVCKTTLSLPVSFGWDNQ